MSVLQQIPPAVVSIPTTMGTVRQIQTGYIAAGTSVAGAGEEARYYDQTITAVLDTAKCLVFLSPYNADLIGARVSSTTNLKIMRPAGGAGAFALRWWVVEYY